MTCFHLALCWHFCKTPLFLEHTFFSLRRIIDSLGFCIWNCYPVAGNVGSLLHSLILCANMMWNSLMVTFKAFAMKVSRTQWWPSPLFDLTTSSSYCAIISNVAFIFSVGTGSCSGLSVVTTLLCVTVFWFSSVLEYRSNSKYHHQGKEEHLKKIQEFTFNYSICIFEAFRFCWRLWTTVFPALYIVLVEES